jgi:hypothetical protein
MQIWSRIFQIISDSLPYLIPFRPLVCDVNFSFDRKCNTTTEKPVFWPRCKTTSKTKEFRFSSFPMFGILDDGICGRGNEIKKNRTRKYYLNSPSSIPSLCQAKPSHTDRPCTFILSFSSSHDMPIQAERRCERISPTHSQPGSRCMVSTTFLPPYPQEIPGTHCIGGWVGWGTVWTS